MAHHLDVLDLLGLVPRELGAVQVHFDPVLVDAERCAHVTALLQPAFDGRITGKVLPTAVTAEGDRAIAAGLAIPLPPLEGQVIRWRFSFPLLAVPDEILFRLEAPVPANASRLRAAWKLLETVEQPKEVRRASAALLEPSGGDALGFGLHFALGLAMGHLVIPLGGTLASVADVSEGPRQIVRHPAGESLDGFVAQVIRGSAPLHQVDQGQELVWKPGMEPPRPPPLPPMAAPVPTPSARSTRSCPQCGADVNIAEAERERMCPNCGTPWCY
ncbi:MAG: hypothetical protein HY901_05760 [Deltaproteobacteria bacterium]|nr:hypothetical protein [Deltaproteobacteria bacterium]